MTYFKKGPKLPCKLRGSAMVSSPSGQGVVVIGGYNHNEFKYSNNFLELHSSQMKWIKLQQTLQYARSHHIVFAIPNDFTNILPEEPYE